MRIMGLKQQTNYLLTAFLEYCVIVWKQFINTLKQDFSFSTRFETFLAIFCISCTWSCWLLDKFPKISLDFLPSDYSISTLLILFGHLCSISWNFYRTFINDCFFLSINFIYDFWLLDLSILSAFKCFSFIVILVSIYCLNLQKSLNSLLILILIFCIICLSIKPSNSLEICSYTVTLAFPEYFVNIDNALQIKRCFLNSRYIASFDFFMTKFSNSFFNYSEKFNTNIPVNPETDLEVIKFFLTVDLDLILNSHVFILDIKKDKLQNRSVFFEPVDILHSYISVSCDDEMDFCAYDLYEIMDYFRDSYCYNWDSSLNLSNLNRGVCSVLNPDAYLDSNFYMNSGKIELEVMALVHIKRPSLFYDDIYILPIFDDYSWNEAWILAPIFDCTKFMLGVLVRGFLYPFWRFYCMIPEQILLSEDQYTFAHYFTPHMEFNDIYSSFTNTNFFSNHSFSDVSSLYTGRGSTSAGLGGPKDDLRHYYQRRVNLEDWEEYIYILQDVLDDRVHKFNWMYRTRWEGPHDLAFWRRIFIANQGGYFKNQYDYYTLYGTWHDRWIWEPYFVHDYNFTKRNSQTSSWTALWNL